MAVNETGAIFKALSFDGESSRTYGIYITGEAVYNAPERDVEMVTIPGRNGAFALDKGRFENIEVTYPAGMFADTEQDFAKGISDFRNMLCSRQGYCRLTDEYNPDEFRLAVYKSGLEVSPAQLRAGEFNITFECKPQRYLMSGQQKFIVGDWGETEVKTGDVITFDNTSGIMAVKSAEVALEPIQDLHGYDKPWSGGNGKNLLPNSWVTTSNNGIIFTANADGTVTANNTATANAQLSIQIPSSLVGDYYFTINAGNDTNAFAYIWDVTANARAKQWNGTSACLNAEANNNREVQLVSGHTNRFVLYVSSGKTLNNFVFRPMITAKTETNFTFEPYSNICPITGASDVEICVRGHNQWDEEWEVGGINASTGENEASSNRIRSKNYIPVLPNTQYYIKGPLQMYGYDADKNFIDLFYTAGVSGTATTQANCHYARFRTVTGHTTYNNDISINYPSTFTSYEPYNGNTYTTSLGTTVYGGSVDVVAGTGQSEWANIASYNGETITEPWLSSMDVYSAGATPTTGAQVVYKLATPTTLTLTPTTIDTIQGVNYVWSPQGTLTLEIGDDPDFIVNPTLFGCGPLIETKGYGNISFNGHTISLANGAIGTVNLWNRTHGGSLNGSITKKFATGQFNPTDTFSFTVSHMFTLYEDTPSIVNTNGNATNGYSDNNDGSVTYWIDLPCTFTVGTTNQTTNKSTYTFGSKKVIANMSVSYDSSTGTIVYSVTTETVNNPTFASSTQFGFTISDCNAASTLDRLGDPTYIDCDLGEAYKINDGDVVSLNSFIDLGSNLPELASGANKITCDNTFTEVAITPRYWTV